MPPAPPLSPLQVINEGWTKWLGVHLKDLKSEERAKKIAAMSIIHANPWNADEMWVCCARVGCGGDVVRVTVCRWR